MPNMSPTAEIPHALIVDPLTLPIDVCVYALLAATATRHGRNSPARANLTLAQLADTLAVSENTITRSLRRLAVAPYIERTRPIGNGPFVTTLNPASL